MKKLLISLALGLAFMPVMSAQAITVVEKPMGYISVNSTETREITPNTANITFSVETTDINSTRASERNSQISTNIITALKQVLSSDKKATIQTSNYNLRPNYKSENQEENVIKNYTAVNTIIVKTTDISKISTLIDTAVKNNVSNVRGVTLSIENQDQFATDMTNEAVKKTKALAKMTATAVNQKVVGIKSMRVNIYQQSSNGVRLYSAANGVPEIKQDTTTPIEAGKIKLNASVDAEYYVK